MGYYKDSSPQRSMESTSTVPEVLLAAPASGPFISGAPDYQPHSYRNLYNPFPQVPSLDIHAKWMLQPKLDRMGRPRPTEHTGETLSKGQLRSLCDASLCTPIPRPQTNIVSESDPARIRGSATPEPTKKGREHRNPWTVEHIRRGPETIPRGMWNPELSYRAPEIAPTRPAANPNPPFRDVFPIGRRRGSVDYFSSESSDESSEEEVVSPIHTRVVPRRPPVCELFRAPSVPSGEPEPNFPNIWEYPEH